jgi:hypothetical protein
MCGVVNGANWFVVCAASVISVPPKVLTRDVVSKWITKGRLATSSSARFGARQPTYFCTKPCPLSLWRAKASVSEGNEQNAAGNFSSPRALMLNHG